MKKIILSILVVTAVYTASFAQNENNFSFSAGAELSFPSGSFSNTHTVGTGATVQAEYFVMEKLKATATFGVLAYLGNSRAQTIIPLRAGGKYFFTEGFYAGLQTGVGFLSGTYTGTTFAYSPLVGYEFKTKSDKSIDATLKYDAYSGSEYDVTARSGVGTIGAIGFRLAYVF